MIFGRSPSYLSEVYNSVIVALDAQFGWLIEWHPCLTRDRINHYARMLDMKSDGGGVVWGWLDGTFVGTCRPEEKIQRLMYSGYKKRHGMKWQGLATPDGLISSLSGPWLGEINDNRMITESGIVRRIREVSLYLHISFN